METTITKKAVIETIGKKLESKLNSYGFKFVKSKQHLIRTYKGGFDRILLFTNTGYPFSHQELGIDFEIRINAVENIFEKFYNGRFRNMEFAKISTTNSIDYIHLKSEVDKSFYSDSYLECELCKSSATDIETEFILHNESDIEKAGSFLMKFIELRAFDFFEKNKKIEYLNKFFKSIVANNGTDLRSIMISLILMKLTNDDEYDTLSPKYVDWLRPAHGFEEDSKNAINEIVEYLEVNFNK